MNVMSSTNNEIVPADEAQGVPAHLEDLHAYATEYVASSQSPSTIRAYASDWRIFEEFCVARKLESMPASVDTVVYFITHEAKAGRKVKTIERRLSAISDYHLKMSEIPPTRQKDARALQAAMKGIKRTLGVAVEKKHPATDDLILQMLSKIPAVNLIDIRDRALISFGFASAMRRSELSDLTFNDLKFYDKGVVVRLRKSKGDQYGAGQSITVPTGRIIKPVRALIDWLEAAGIEEGPVFRPIVKGGKRCRDMKISGDAIARIIKNRACDAQLDPKLFSGHSLRSGFVTTAGVNDAPINSIMDQTRHKDVNTVREYFQDHEKFKNHAGSSFL